MQKQLMTSLDTLPPSDSGYWRTGDYKADTNQIAIDNLKETVCKAHKMEVDWGKREAQCKECGFGYRFRADQVSVKDGVMTDNKTGRVLLRINP